GWLRGQGDGKEIALDEAGAVVAQPSRPGRIRLDGDHPQRAPRERAGYRTRTGAYLEDKLAGSERRLVDDLVGSCGIKKVLAELATSPVSVCPPPGGHGIRQCPKSGRVRVTRTDRKKLCPVGNAVLARVRTTHYVARTLVGRVVG